MSRWAPGAQGRLVDAAMQLYTERGFDDTTVAEIAARAGVTQRTFFRYFADKREVLFHGQDHLLGEFVRGIRDAPAGAGPVDAVASALDTVASFFDDREHSVLRSAVIAANPSLLEREAYKMTRIAAAMREELEARGVPPLAAGVAAESGVTAFRLAFEQWLVDGETRDMAELSRALLDELRAVAAG